MPLCEDKLISPLAVRFTQQRIRHTFQDGRKVEATIKEIKAMPGVGDYDVILHAPFPTIEIIRWSPNGRRAGGKSHWFSYDNRRLYCLQRVAAQYWPKRVGAVVEVLYADAGAIRKKLDSQTGGLSVSIGHAFATADELDEWGWHQAVREHGDFGDAPYSNVAADDVKATVHDLTDAPAAPSALERLMQSLDGEAVEVSPPLTALANLSSAATEQLKSEVTVPAEEQVTVPAEELVSAPAGAATDGQSLSSLIGQLLVLKTNESPRDRQVSDEASTACCRDRADSTASNSETLEASTLSLASDEVKPSSNSTAEDIIEEANSLESPHEEHVEPAGATLEEQSHAKRKQINAKKAEQARAMAMRAAYLNSARSQLAAQWQMRQWHAAQMHAAHMAQWQHASLAFQANQVAQFAQWQEGDEWAWSRQ